MEDRQDMLSIKAVAKRWNVSERTVYNQIREGKLDSVRIGKSLRVPLAVVTARTMTDSSSQGSLSPMSGLQEAPRLFDNVVDEIAQLKKMFDVQGGRFREFGIANVLQPRRMSGTTIGAIQEALHGAYGEVCLMGVALRGFLFQDGFFHDSLRSRLKEANISVRAILLDPLGNAAKARAVAEGSEELLPSTSSSPKGRDASQALYGTELFRNICRSVLTAERLSSEFEDRVQVKAVDMHPTVWMVSTQSVMFVEIYHLGRSPSDVPGRMIGGCVGELVPVLAIAPNSNLYTLLKASFDHIWSGNNPYLGLKSSSELKAELDKLPIKAF